MHAISRSTSDGHETLHVYIWWWVGPACKASWPSDVVREIACAQIPNFYRREPTFSYSKKRGFGCAWSHIQCQMALKLCIYIYGDGMDPRAKFHGHLMLNVWSRTPKSSNFYVGNLHFCIVKSRGFGCTRSHVWYRMAMKLCTYVYGDWAWIPHAKFHGHPMLNVRSRASKSPISM